jgi:teichoic acid transport system ATP-binding protein
MSEYIVEIKDLNLKYKIFKSRELKTSFFPFLKKNGDAGRYKEVHALKDINLNIEKGKKMGIIGANGAGKSTLLRTIAQVFEPDSGTIKVHTDSVSLLALGVGFQNELSGYENIYLNGVLLGFTKKTLDEKIEEIIEFSELGDFIDAPVKSYSSGMKSRLAFSIVASLEPELLLVDELFSVGDAAFREKSEKKMTELITHNRTVIMVSHTLRHVERFCDVVVWMHKGEIKDIGSPKEIIEAYKKFTKKK